MERKKQFMKKTVWGLMTLMLMLTGAAFSTLTAHADEGGWIDYAQELKLGQAAVDSIKVNDYHGGIEGTKGKSKYYWKIYEITMPKDGLLDVYMESKEAAYLSTDATYDGFAIFDAVEPDNLVWRSYKKDCKIKRKYSSFRDMHYGSAQISLEEGDYYFVVRQYKTYNDPYYLTLKYERQTINLTSITLNRNQLTIKDGSKKKLKAAVFPKNATDKTVEWSSSDPSIAIVSDKGVVEALAPGKTTITAESSDGEIFDECEVTVTCVHKYKTTITPASTQKDGWEVVKCSKCKDKTSKKIYAIRNVRLSKTSYVYNGKTRKPAVVVTDSQGEILKSGSDYNVTYPKGRKNVGKFIVVIRFKGKYTGTVKKTFKVVPKSTTISLVEPEKGGFNVTWEEEANQSTGYEIAHSTSNTFSKARTVTEVIDDSSNVSRKISGLEKGKLYYIRVRVYTDVVINEKEQVLYSDWSEVSAVVVR